MTDGIPPFERYRSDAMAEGFDEVVERVWAADAVASDHSHPFAVKALVVQGEMWLTSPDGCQHLRPGDSFTLGADIDHDERYGREGATYWAARRHIAR